MFQTAVVEKIKTHFTSIFILKRAVTQATVDDKAHAL
jgi:hypothetical protein